MRVSADQGDPGYRPDLIGLITILIDGEPQSKAITADEDQGFVVRYCIDGSGIRLDRIAEVALRETVFGIVRVTMTDGSDVPISAKGQTL